jgi:hypothetical protein
VTLTCSKFTITFDKYVEDSDPKIIASITLKVTADGCDQSGAG